MVEKYREEPGEAALLEEQEGLLLEAVLLPVLPAAAGAKVALRQEAEALCREGLPLSSASAPSVRVGQLRGFHLRVPRSQSFPLSALEAPRSPAGDLAFRQPPPP